MDKRSIKVLHLIPTLSSGGAERQLVNLVGSTSKESVNHVVCVIGEADFFGPLICESGYRVIELGITAKRPFLSAAARFRKVINAEEPDIVHSWLYNANVSARLATLPSRRIPIITSLQLPDYEPEAARIGNWNPKKVSALKAIDKFTATMTRTYFVACSEFVRSSYIRHFAMENGKAEVIYNSVDPKFLESSEGDVEGLHNELELPAGAFIYLNVGRLDPQKNHAVLFEAFKNVLGKVPNAYLLLAGIGGTKSSLMTLAKNLGISQRVFFLGRRHDIGPLLELSDVFVFPSSFEGLGVALVEAMFKSRPSIASRIEVLQEVITDGENGLLIDPTSPLELENAMVKLYMDPELRQSLGNKAFEMADARFNASVTARQWEELYKRIFNEGRSA